MAQTKIGWRPYVNPIVPLISSGLGFSYDAFDSTSYPGNGNIFYDISGNNRNMTITPKVIAPGELNLGAAFNTSGGIKRFGFVADGGYGSNSYGGVSYSPSITSGFTFGGWVKTNTNGGYTFQKGADGIYGGWDIIFSVGSDNISFTILNTSYQGVGVSGNIALTNNTWYYVTGQYIHNVGLKIYVNGVLTNTLNQSGLQMVNRGTGWTINSVATNIMGRSIVSTYHMYTRVLTSGEILQNFNSNKSRYGY